MRATNKSQGRSLSSQSTKILSILKLMIPSKLISHSINLTRLKMPMTSKISKEILLQEVFMALKLEPIKAYPINWVALFPGLDPVV